MNEDVVSVRPSAGWRELFSAVLLGRGFEGLAEVLHRVTGRPVTIEVTGDGVLAAAGSYDELAQTEADSPLTLFDPGPEVGPSIAETGEAATLPAARRGGWWIAPIVMDGAVVATVNLCDPGATCSPADLLALEQAASTAALQLLLDRVRTEREIQVWGDFATELLEDPTADRVRRHAHRFGFDLDEPYRAVIVEPAGRPPFRFAGRCQTIISGLVSRPFLSTERDSRLLLAIGDELPWRRLAERLAETLGTSLRVGVGGREPLCNLRRSVCDADAALRMRSTTGEPTVAIFDDLGIWRILARAPDVDLDEFVTRWLGPLIRYDGTRHAELVKSLTTYFAANGDLDVAAARLFVHRNTLKYRLSRITEISGVDLHDAHQRLHLELACEAWTVRQATSRDPSG
jgi:hypothetical protein